MQATSKLQFVKLHWIEISLYPASVKGFFSVSVVFCCPYEGQNPYQKSCSVVLMKDRTHIKNCVLLCLWRTEPISKIVFSCPYEGQNPYQISCSVVLMKDRTHIKNCVLLSLWRREPISKIVFCCPYEGQKPYKKSCSLILMNPYQKSCSVVLMKDRTHIKNCVLLCLWRTEPI